MEKILERLKEPLKIEEVDFRVQSINTGGYAVIIPYKDARVDMNRLDEVCGPLWQDKYQLIDGQLFCSIGIKFGEEWIWREDVGVAPNNEKEKGRASDAFKRAGFRWGIGRELYDYPLIELKLNQDEFEVKEIQGKRRAFATWNLKIKDWKWSAVFSDGKLQSLSAVDQKGAKRFDTNSTAKPQSDNTPVNTPSAPVSHAPKPKANTGGKAKTKNPPSDNEKPWLNKMDGKEYTNEYLNVLKGIASGIVKSVDDVRKYYKVNSAIAREIEEKLKLIPAKSA